MTDQKKALEVQDEVAALEAKIQKLQQLCQEIDPYVPLKGNQREALKEWGLEEEQDPFVITNTLVLALENGLQRKASLMKGQGEISNP